MIVSRGRSVLELWWRHPRALVENEVQTRAGRIMNYISNIDINPLSIDCIISSSFFKESSPEVTRFGVYRASKEG